MTDKILSKLEDMQKDIVKIKISSARSEEHLKNLNGTVKRHETDIVDIQKLQTKVQLGIGKLLGIVTVISGMVSLVIGSLLKVFK